MPLPTVSILLLTYNHAEFIVQCLDSILAQSREGFALTVHVADDASTDKTGDIVAAYAQKYPHIIQHHLNAKNMGATPNHHHHLRKIKSDYYILLEGDDYLLGTEKLVKQVYFLETHKNYVGCCHDTVFVGNETESIYAHPLPETLTVQDFASGRYHVHTSSMIWRNIYQGELPFWHSEIYNDVFINIIHTQNGPVKYFPDKWSAYRRHDASLTGIGRHDVNFVAEKMKISFKAIEVYRDLFPAPLKKYFAAFLFLRAITIVKHNLVRRRKILPALPFVGYAILSLRYAEVWRFVAFKLKQGQSSNA